MHPARGDANFDPFRSRRLRRWAVRFSWDGSAQRRSGRAEKNYMAATTTAPSATRTSRAVLRDVEAGSTVDCALCGERVKFQAKVRHQQVICNVYENGTWRRVEHFHAECYADAADPHGEPETSRTSRVRASSR